MNKKKGANMKKKDKILIALVLLLIVLICTPIILYLAYN